MNNNIRVEGSFKNNRLWRAIRKRYASVSEMCRCESELMSAEVRISALMTFRDSPCDRYGNYRDICKLLEEILDVPREELFPLRLYEFYGADRARLSTQVIELNLQTALNTARSGAEKIAGLLPQMTSDLQLEPELPIRTNQIDAMLSLLRSSQAAEVIALYFGLRGESPMKYKEIGLRLGVSRERVRQIKVAALNFYRRTLRRSASRNVHAMLEIASDIAKATQIVPAPHITRIEFQETFMLKHNEEMLRQLCARAVAEIGNFRRDKGMIYWARERQSTSVAFLRLTAEMTLEEIEHEIRELWKPWRLASSFTAMRWLTQYGLSYSPQSQVNILVPRAYMPTEPGMLWISPRDGNVRSVELNELPSCARLPKGQLVLIRN